ncbi:MAG: hypothetical protein IJJ82_03795 [Clostridia bacterium]|nr:hypothetical protein [Clostridia bacterium]MBR0518842.1 hypothetical protein [bacterium]
MLVKDVKRIGKVGKNLLKNKDANEIIETIIEKPLQKACKDCKAKNIETVMSSANKNNLVRKNKIRINKKEAIQRANEGKTQTFLTAGRGYAWLMLNYNTLSDENRKILFDMEKELGEDSVWFVKSNYIEVMNKMRKPFRLKQLVEKFDDTYAEKFKEKQLILMYNNRYPRRSVFLRMPIEETTTCEEVEQYFAKVIERLAPNI